MLFLLRLCGGGVFGVGYFACVGGGMLIKSPQNPKIFSLFAAIHLFISSCDEIKISARWIKKLVAATGCVYVSIHFYNLAIASVTAGTVCPAAHFCVYGICISNNNADFIQYLPKTFSNIFTFGGDTPFYLISRRN